MVQFLLRRLFVAVLVALTVSVIAFTLLHISGDLAQVLAGEDASAAEIDELRRQLGLDRPLPIQYFEWLGNMMAGDFGHSFFYDSTVTEMLADKMPVTLTLGCLAILIAIIVSMPLGVLAAMFPNSWLDRLCLSVAVFGQALPSFWLALILIMFFGVELRWLPVSGTGTWKHFVMPAFTLATFAMPAIMRLTRAGMMDVLQSDYIRTARAKGVRPFSVLFKHALRNAVLPVVSLTAVQLGFLLGGSIVVEAVFALQGVGYLAWESILKTDFMVVQATVLMLSLFYIVLTLFADILNALLDPRLRIG